MAVHTNPDDDNKQISTRLDVSLEASVLLKTDEADVSLKTDETDISFEMMIIELRSDLIPRRGTYYLDQHQTGVITTTSYAGAGSSVGRCQPKILNIRKHNYFGVFGGDMPSATCINCNFSDGEKTATVQITGGDDNLSNHPGASDATAAAEQPTSDGSNAEEQLVPAAGNALKSTHGLVA
uniref:Uncharacterized protein n=1 Tax=Brassica oleracea var. oleracea TaxID=109376 RepID=A0A0D3AAT8_BRAOL